MVKVREDEFSFAPGKESTYRRMSVRECARIQTFPDTHQFCYDRIIDGYKMIGNAVPVELAYHLAKQIMETLKGKPAKKSSVIETKPPAAKTIPLRRTRQKA